MNLFLTLFYEFFKTGLFAVGGGLATLPFLYRIAGTYSWLETSMLSDMIAVSESTPGPMGVNMSTYAGFNAGFNAGSTLGSLGMGILAGITATLSLVLPSVIIIIIVAHFLEKFKGSPLVESAFSGLRPAVCGLIASACLTVFETACLHIEQYKLTQSLAKLFDSKAIVLFIVFFIITNKFKKHPIVYIVPAAVLGILLKM